MTRKTPLLDVRDLSTWFTTPRAVLRAVDGISLTVNGGEVLGLVGESGSGKSVAALSLMRLVPPPGQIVQGEIHFGGQDLMTLGEEELRQIRGRQIAMVFQDPMTSLNPSMTIGDQISEGARFHLGLTRRASDERAIDLLDKVGIPTAKKRSGSYPHEFSGGMKQRVIIAMALACEPSLLLADEPTTALDVTIQAQILELLLELSGELDFGMILITHDLGIAAGICDRVMVMYAGQIVESANVSEIFERPYMPYTVGLLQSAAGIGSSGEGSLYSIPGMPPDLRKTISGCRFASRCDHVRSEFCSREPELKARPSPDHLARCWGTEPVGGWIEQ